MAESEAPRAAPGLDALREQIDQLDQQLLELLNRRAGLAQQAAAAKRRTDGDASCYRAEREARILRRVKSINPGPLGNEEAVRLMREVISACMSMEQPMRIACLGPRGTFTEAAARKHFGQSAEITALDDIDQVFREVEAGECRHGVVPVENSIEGAVNHTLDRLAETPLELCGEVELPIHQCLLSREKNLEDIAVVYSHEQSLAQCRRWLGANLAAARRAPVSSNAAAAAAAAGRKKAAAVAGAGAGSAYGLPVLRNNIEDDPGNATRFLVLGSSSPLPSGQDKTSVLFAVQSRPGALLKLLTCFADHDVNMTKIQSRPSRQGTWEYVFFADVAGHADDGNVAAALAALRERAAMVKLLGSYPVAVT